MTTEQPRLYAETEDGSTVILQLKRNRHYPGRFATLMMEITAMLATFDRPPCYFRVLLHLLTVLDPIQKRRIFESEIGPEVGISRASTTRAMEMLKADNVVIAEGRAAQITLRLNHNLLWASSAEKFNRTVETDPDPEITDARGR